MSIIKLSFQSFKVQLIVDTTHIKKKKKKKKDTTHKALSILGKQAH